jgi:predicted transcriptional regulator
MSERPPLSDPISLRVPADVLSSVEAIAKASDRSRSWIIVRALRSYVAGEGREILEAAQGRAEIASGKSFDLDQVMDELEQDLRRKGGKAA